ncbi:MAG: aminotransferase class I/II-fold pyridoxal phosphate-dependent enzyme [Clostridiaceae bacterium]|jgi:arginine/lysine/ornithine decarboxylase|nr:aminotransferase class I/II-fold pyridoxal phosphate-dependent enzyme [Clostridiaceae bacterium]
MATILNAPLYDAVRGYVAKTRFHMPGHGGNNLDGGLYLSAPFDITELPFCDNLKNPSGVIRDAEILLAEAYLSEDALMFATGATAAVQSALYAARERYGKNAVIADNCHCSVHSALRLLGMSATVTGGEHKGYVISPEDAAAALDKSSAKILVITTPDYYGRTLDTAKFKAIAAERGACLIADSAHGAHFAFSPLFPPPASQYADLTVYGAHKTLPVFTGGAILCGNTILIAKARVYRSEYATTSPNYIILASLDYARAYLSINGRTAYERVFADIRAFKRSLPQFSFLDNSDFTKLYFNCPSAALEAAGVYPEMYDGNGSLLIVTPFNSRALKPLVEKLKSVTPLKSVIPVASINKRDRRENTDGVKIRLEICDEAPSETEAKSATTATSKSDATPMSAATAALPKSEVKTATTAPHKTETTSSAVTKIAPPKKTAKSTEKDVKPMGKPSAKTKSHKGKSLKSVLVEIDDAKGYISEFDIGLYPPGVPRILAGNVITADDIIFMKKNKNTLFNLVNGKVCVII